jgi:hypothetical protein
MRKSPANAKLSGLRAVDRRPSTANCGHLLKNNNGGFGKIQSRLWLISN